ncbi:hypothetical protein [Pseudolabrys sp. FHR47]|uniref:hypothetical protein n=1 Tax=Pseudolabrys sp. FHR47 TaxID=2562284 RepID=UPI0010BE24FD|nr:hypothetical protein [Pseudolabrys sp. FHR47]
MQYKLYRYELSTTEGKEINPDRQFKIFDEAKGPDIDGRYAEYRGKRDSVLMHLRNYGVDFIGLVGRHSTKREVTAYDSHDDITARVNVDDDDYPHAAFICYPRLRMIMCTDTGGVRANAAMQRLHRVLAHRKKLLLTVDEISETFDLRKAVNRFRVVEVLYEVFPVNPHTGDLGKQLDESRKLDHIKKLNGSIQGAISDPLKLNGGFLSAVQELQTSGHAKVGFRAFTEDKGVEIAVPKPSQRRELSESADKEVVGENIGVRIQIEGKEEYPFSQKFVHRMRQIVVKFKNIGKDE